jgi:hypothetical protein
MASVPATANRSLFDDEIPADIVSPSAVCGPEQPNAAQGPDLGGTQRTPTSKKKQA